MKVVSKFLTAEVRITRVAWAGRRVTVEGVVKEIMPMTVEMGLEDARTMLLLATAPARARLAARLPGPLARWLTGAPSRREEDDATSDPATAPLSFARPLRRGGA